MHAVIRHIVPIHSPGCRYAHHVIAIGASTTLRSINLYGHDIASKVFTQRTQ